MVFEFFLESNTFLAIGIMIGANLMADLISLPIFIYIAPVGVDLSIVIPVLWSR